MKRNVLLVLVLLVFIPILITLFIAFAVWTQKAVRTSNSESGETASEAVGDSQDNPGWIRGGETSKPLTLGGFRLPTAKKYAVLIGVTDYVTMNDLKYTVRDVEAIRDQLLEIGFFRENVQMLTTGSDLANQPTRQNIQRAVKSALDQAKLGDLVFFAFAGHGAQLGDEVFFCPQDTVDEDISSTAVSITNVMADLSKSKADFKWLVVDACRNNPFRNRVAGVRSIQKIDAPPKGIALFQSCAQDEYSYEDESVEHGLFTSNFVKGMQGAADSNNDGVLTFLEVCTYTTSRTVSDVQQKFRANQRPYLSGNISDFVLMEDLNRPKAIAFFNAARQLRKEKKYDESKIQIEEALKLCPNTPEYLEERDIIQRFIELVSATPGGDTLPTPVAPAVATSVTPASSAVLEGAKTWESYIERMKMTIPPFNRAVASYKNVIITFNPDSRKAQDAETALRKAVAAPYSCSSAFLRQEQSKLESMREEGYRTDVAPYKTVEANIAQLEKIGNLFSPKAKTADLLMAMVNIVAMIPVDVALPPEFYPILEQYEKLWEQEDSSREIAVSRDGKYLATASGYDIIIRAFRTGEVLQTLKGHTSSVNSLSYSPDGRFIASGSSDKTVRIWNAQTGECVKTLEGHGWSVLSVSYSPDGLFIASGNGEGYAYSNCVRIWNAQTGECVKTLDHKYDVNSVSYSPDGRFIASGEGGNNRTVNIWNAQTGECEKTLEGHSVSVSSVSYSPDGRFIASAGSTDRTVRIWNVQTGKCVKTLEGHTGDVSSVSYSPYGRLIASGSGGDKTVRIWNAQTGECVKTLEGHTNSVWSVSYSPDGKYLCVGTYGALTVWRVAE